MNNGIFSCIFSHFVLYLGDVKKTYNLLYKEVMFRLNSLYMDNNLANKEVLND